MLQADDVELVVVDIAAGTYFLLHDVAAVAWIEFSKATSFADIVTTITSRYDVSAEQAESDLSAFLSQLLASGVVTRDD